MALEVFPLVKKVILITGTTAGIGEAAARQLYALGGNVILHGRNPVRLEAVIRRILEAVPNSPGALDILCADFSVMQDVFDMAEAFKKRYDRLHVLINNAGAIYLRREVTPDGIEKTFAVNHLAHFLLTRQLLEIIKDSAPARVITVASSSHLNAKLDFNDLQLKNKYQAFTAYSNAKLCNILFAYELARRFRRTPELTLSSNVVHPGLVATNLAKNNGWITRTGVPLFHFYSRLRRRIRTPDKGAETVVFLAVDPQVASINGKYFVDKEQAGSSVLSYDHDMAANLWGISEYLVQNSVPVLKAEREARETAALLDSVINPSQDKFQTRTASDFNTRS